MQEKKEKLIDEKSEKKIDWRKYKLNSLELASVYDRLGLESKYIRLHQCSSHLEFKKQQNNCLKLFRAQFCKVRLCPMCAWRRSLKIFGQVSKVMNCLDDNYSYRYIFCTLTVRNVSGRLLNSQVDAVFKAFNLLTKKKEFKKLSRGWFRCFEVTHNWDRDDYHPHFHVIIAVSSSYFTDSSIYLTQAKWASLWRSCLGVDYDPIVDIRTVKANKGGKYSKAVAEVSKYAVKAGDYILSGDYASNLSASASCEDSVIDKDIENISAFINAKTDEAVSYIDPCLHGRRLVAFGGVFRSVHKLLNLGDAVDGDLVNTDNDDDVRDDLSHVIYFYRWDVGYKDYFRDF